ncbi:Phosphopantetheinyl transferase PptA [Sulfitobacter noctilucae]|uniref:4'-phosphopantetheinyl transferase family protein n=1 Tax=Sulfitobacter noctilucae TaxID=1342302 RepID=UPI0004699536|nr:4'-phosphopantetheinyl transferase superfamily protein [Sulfitobacter noctilucae]KIN61600.1 Phosphopantetheinyl transferase PptA [Sulfitobacter noctilucae]
MQINHPDRLIQTQAVVARLFDGVAPVGVAVTDPRAPQPALIGNEAAHLTRAFPARKREFAAGRAAVRQAMASLDLPPKPVPADADRAPLWPDGLAGSISHSTSLCAAVVTCAGMSLGVDLEEITDLEPGLLSSICSDQELARIAGPDQLRLAKLIFSTKEAVYKAQYPLTGLLIGFDHVDIALDLRRLAFTATFVKPAGCFTVGDQLPGRFDGVANHLVTAAWADIAG